MSELTIGGEILADSILPSYGLSVLHYVSDRLSCESLEQASEFRILDPGSVLRPWNNKLRIAHAWI